MKTVCIQIGNSDDKLSQKEWNQFVHDVRVTVQIYCEAIHFDGGSNPDSPWQNHAWVCEVVPFHDEKIRRELETHRTNYRQDSIAWLEGETQFIRSPSHA